MATKIKTVASAFKYTGRDIAALEVFKGLPEQDRAWAEAQYTQMVLIEAKNKEANGGKKWEPDWEDGSWKYQNWVWLKRNPVGVGFVVDGADYDYTDTITDVGSRLCLKEARLVDELNRDFPEVIQIAMAE